VTARWGCALHGMETTPDGPDLIGVVVALVGTTVYNGLSSRSGGGTRCPRSPSQQRRADVLDAAQSPWYFYRVPGACPTDCHRGSGDLTYRPPTRRLTHTRVWRRVYFPLDIRLGIVIVLRASVVIPAASSLNRRHPRQAAKCELTALNSAALSSPSSPAETASRHCVQFT
jgi:hypothetical protein